MGNMERYVAMAVAFSLGPAHLTWSPGEIDLPKRRSQVFLLGPSHFLPRHLEEAHIAFERTDTSKHCVSLARREVDSMALEALPIFHRCTWEIIQEAYQNYDHTVLLVPNWYFGNRYVQQLKTPQDLFLDLPLEAYNVVRENVQPEHNEVNIFKLPRASQRTPWTFCGIVTGRPSQDSIPRTTVATRSARAMS
ncbi:unnamed protein product [Effrenium voratum]|uniref:Uncharacterized protein n=1 Tax=Effrenium voratum TaxID=2562239 RepID=A0AA36IAI8_9DINO|nr:unnamed protein product [Effrenium voratum]CAJ1384163.1 unnamed protein product [Effrenium voratum]CAJ1436126.1 unnamed protein product [Effrenium voratum]